MARYAWPGNLRQLRNVLRTMLALSDSDRLRLDDFDERWLQGGAAGALLRLGQALARLGELSSGARIGVVEMADGRAAIDVDKPADLDLVRRLVARVG